VLTARVAAAGAFDLDNFGAERRETASDIWTCQKVAVVDDANPFERTCLH
jgi:hypothetical protein